MLNPYLENGHTDLTIITGYSNPAMVDRHISNIRDIRDIHSDNINIKLLIGMGVGRRDKNAYLRLEQRFGELFQCYLMPRTQKVHSKLYKFENLNNGIEIFLGSANYSQNGLINASQKELLYKINDSNNNQINTYIADAFLQAIPIGEIDDSQLIHTPSVGVAHDDVEVDLRNGGFIEIVSENGLIGLRLSLLTRNGSLPQRSGLNWGQRPEQNREPNQAYIRVPAQVQRMDFFPERGTHFIIEDQNNEQSININQIFFAMRAQDNGKAIESTENNSIIGVYFRNKLGVTLGAPVTLQHLLDYGKTYVDFYKIDDETYLMDF